MCVCACACEWVGGGERASQVPKPLATCLLALFTYLGESCQTPEVPRAVHLFPPQAPVPSCAVVFSTSLYLHSLYSYDLATFPEFRGAKKTITERKTLTKPQGSHVFTMGANPVSGSYNSAVLQDFCVNLGGSERQGTWHFCPYSGHKHLDKSHTDTGTGLLIQKHSVFRKEIPDKQECTVSTCMSKE